MKKFLKITLLVVLTAGIIGTFVFLWMKSRPKVVVYETVNAEITDLQKTTVATGKVEPRDEILIKPQISGIIDEVYKEAGQSIRKGEVIAKVKVIPELGQVNSAESRVRLVTTAIFARSRDGHAVNSPFTAAPSTIRSRVITSPGTTEMTRSLPRAGILRSSAVSVQPLPLTPGKLAPRDVSPRGNAAVLPFFQT